MKKYFTLIALTLLVFSSALYGQEKKNETYTFLNAKEIKNVNKYVTALKTANMTKFRYANRRNVIEFENGLKVELFSANELTSKGYTVDNRRLLTSSPTNTNSYTFDLSDDGKTILQKFTKTKIKH